MSTVNPVNMLRIPVVAEAWFIREQHRRQSGLAELWALLDQVKDPEVPVLSLWDLGVLCEVKQDSHRRVTVVITPTYSGCPALDAMRADIATVLTNAGISDFNIQTRLAPAWTTDWLSPRGRAQLREYGIAPPISGHSGGGGGACAQAQGLTPEAGVECPQCGSVQTRRISEFGSTACKALFQCQVCHEPFDYFKHL